MICSGVKRFVGMTGLLREMPCAALNAWNALVTSGKVAADDTVLVLGTGGVSLFALQFAKLHGARVIVTSSSDAKLARAQALGADATINYRTTPDWDQDVFRLTGKAGADHIVEVGGTATFPKALRALALGGTVSVIGGVSVFGSQVPLTDILGKSALILGIYVGNRDMFEAMNRAITRHQHLGFHRVHRRAIEGLDPQVLLDPFAEEFDLASTLVKLGNLQGGGSVKLLVRNTNRFSSRDRRR